MDKPELSEHSLSKAHDAYDFDYNWQYVPKPKAKPFCPEKLTQGNDDFQEWIRRSEVPVALAWYEYYSRPDNIDDFLRDCVKIVDKAGDLIPLDVDNPRYRRAQRYFLAKIVESFESVESFLGICLKARQWGCSTLVDGIIVWLCIFNPRYKALIVGQQDKTTQELLQSVRTMLENLPLWIRPRLKYANMKERLTFNDFVPEAKIRKFKHTWSWIRIFKITDGTGRSNEKDGGGFTRGMTIRGFHGTEVAMWPDDKARETKASLAATVSLDYKGSFMVLESTAMGISGMFADTWHGAVAKKNFHVPIFIPWFWIADYTLDAKAAKHSFPDLDIEQIQRCLDRHIPGAAGLDEEEVSLWQRFGLNAGQILWRRRQIGIMEDPSRFKQEYPATPSEAFLREGDSVFSRKALERYLAEQAKPPVQRMIFDDNDSIWPEKQKMGEDPTGNIFIWQGPQKGKEYIVINDPSEGSNAYLTKMRDPTDGSIEEGYVKKGDNTALLVGCLTDREIVCRVKGRIPPEQAAGLAFKLGYLYNTAVVVVENNAGYGSTLIDRGRTIGYPAIYMQELTDHAKNTQTFRYGWYTNGETRPHMFSLARGAIWRMSWKIPDEELLAELVGMIYKRTRNGAPREEAGPGSKDDLAICFAIMVRVAKDISAVEGQDQPPDDSPMARLRANRASISPEAFAMWKCIYEARAKKKRRRWSDS